MSKRQSRANNNSSTSLLFLLKKISLVWKIAIKIFCCFLPFVVFYAVAFNTHFLMILFFYNLHKAQLIWNVYSFFFFFYQKLDKRCDLEKRCHCDSCVIECSHLILKKVKWMIRMLDGNIRSCRGTFLFSICLDERSFNKSSVSRTLEGFWKARWETNLFLQNRKS